MRYLDDLIVTIATCILRGVLAVGTGLVYVQFFTLAFMLAMFGTVILAVLLAVAKAVLLGA